MAKGTVLMGILSISSREDEEKIYLEGSCIIKLSGSKEKLDLTKLGIDIASQQNAFELSFTDKNGKTLPMGFSLNKYKISVKKDDACNFDIQSKLILNYDNRYFGRILYYAKDLRKGKNHNTTVFFHNGMSMYFRQNKYNTLWFTVRDTNQYDYPEGQKRLQDAAENAKHLADKDIILMYEKNCMRYEESASVLYEKLIDAGYDNVYYVVNFDNPSIQNLDEKYRKNLIDKDSDKHLEYFFASNKFISSESTDHALQLRIASKLVLDKINSKNLKYVFLQHGVMYMVSLNSDLRTVFRNNGRKFHKTVVSSQLEADHFVDLAGMQREDLYVTGLAKFDKCYRNENADKIIIMLTWRRWETNQASTDITATKYHKMIERIYNAVPDKLKDKVIILPHPLMAERFQGSSGLGEHIMTPDSYDLIFRDCDMLITDYSSIAYDAFYRGANVAFCWDEKDECMEHYGEGSHLMLNEDNAFGDICMNEEDIKRAIENNYGKSQTQENIDKYRKIVEFHDGKNSDRIIEHLKQDGIIA